MPIGDSLKQKREAARRTVNPFYKFFNVNKIGAVTNINSDKIYNNVKGFYDSLTHEEKESIANTLAGKAVEFFKSLGYTANISLKKPKS